MRSQPTTECCQHESIALVHHTFDVSFDLVERTELDRAASAAATIRSAKKRDRHGRRGGR
jgi:hypothetical protein